MADSFLKLAVQFYRTFYIMTLRLWLHIFFQEKKGICIYAQKL